jgi:hypothetical protein
VVGEAVGAGMVISGLLTSRGSPIGVVRSPVKEGWARDALLVLKMTVYERGRDVEEEEGLMPFQPIWKVLPRCCFRLAPGEDNATRKRVEFPASNVMTTQTCEIEV